MSDRGPDGSDRADTGEARREATRARRRAWSPSSALVTVSVTLFVLVAVAMFVAQETLANTLSLYAVAALAAAVVLRFVESLAGERIGAGYDRLHAAFGAVTARLAAVARPALAAVVDRASVASARIGAPNRVGRDADGAWATSRVVTAYGSAGLAVLLSAVAGLLLAAWFGAAALVWCAVGLLALATLRTLAVGDR